MNAANDARRRLRFGPELRIRRHGEFDRVMRRGVRLSDHRLTLWADDNGLSHPRLGLVVGRRHGDAVARHRLKRVLREAFRLSQHDLPPGVDLAVAPSPTTPLSLASARAALVQLAQRAAKRLRAKTDD